MTHEIKLQRDFCDAVYEGRKTFEIRKNDRGYQNGDRIKFIPVYSTIDVEFSHPIQNKTYEITYILSGWNIPQDYVVFSIKEIS